MVVATIVTLVLFSGGPNGAISFAQQTTSPPAPTIKWLNPDSETSNEVSAKDDDPGQGADNTYHLVATVNQVPPSPVVTFLRQTGTATPTPIGTATLVGNDTFHFNWDQTSMPADGDYTLIAVLSSNGQEVSRDTETVVVNNTTEGAPENVDPTTAQSETVEIIDPVVVDTLGFYDRPGDPRFTAVIKVRHSAGVTSLTPYYTTSPPGTEPTFTECKSGSQTTANSADGVQCELVAPTTPTQVTGVAVVAGDNSGAPSEVPAPDTESGDAHRVTGYQAFPTSFTIAGVTTSVASNTCTPAIIATLFDQNGNTIGGANTDVHGQGPDDGLQFDDSDASGNTSSSHKAPEGHTTQVARDCESTPPPTGGTQGVHAETTADRKHIESTTGTADDGTFKFRFFSAVAGATQYTIWSDDDDNDRLCGLEAQGDGSIGWDQAPPAATGVADEEASCVRPGQSTTTTPTPTATATSPSPTPTATSPSPTPTQSSASPSPTTSTPPPPIAYSSETTINYNGKAFTGKVKSNLKKCRRDRSMLLKKQKPGKDKTVGKDRTNRTGGYKIREPKANGTYYTVAKVKRFTDGSGRPVTCGQDRSKKKRV